MWEMEHLCMVNKSAFPQEPPPFSELPKWFVYHLKKDWPIMKTAPLGLTAFTGLIMLVAWLFIWKVVVPEKNEQLASKQAVIDAKEATIQQLQTTLAVNGLNTFPLKKRANTLADQLEKYADSMAADPQKQTDYSELFIQRFQGRIGTIIYDCDQQGAHLDELDNNSPAWQALRSYPVKPEYIHNIANLIRKLAAQLKD